MKKQKLELKKVILFVMLLIILIAILYFACQTRYGRYVNYALFMISLLSILMKVRGKPSALIMAKYTKAYAPFIANAFTNDKKSHNQLMAAMIYWDRQQFKKAHKVLDKLLDKCTCTNDYLAVYNVKSICYSRERKVEPLIEVYKKILQYNPTDSRTWSNLGWIYMKQGNSGEAFTAYNNAIEYNPENALAYNNMAVYYIKMINPEKAIEYAEKSLELDSQLHQPLSTLAMAYKLVGDEQTSQKYASLYIQQGGDADKLTAALENLSY